MNAIEDEFDRLKRQKPAQQRRIDRRPPGQIPRRGSGPGRGGRLGLLLALIDLLSGEDEGAETAPAAPRGSVDDVAESGCRSSCLVAPDTRRCLTPKPVRRRLAASTSRIL